jgi:hypothetical protein
MPKEKTLKPEGVKILTIQPTVLPGAMAQTLNVIVYGLGDDSQLYSWDGKQVSWVLVENA